MFIERAGVALVGLALLLLGCAASDDGPPEPPDPGPPMLEVVNQGTGEDRPLEQLLLHRTIDDYGDANNRLEQPLRLGERVLIRDVTSRSYYITVVRKARSLKEGDGVEVDRVALTTARPLAVSRGRYVVWVFDESFRFFKPTPSFDGGPPTPLDATVDFLFDISVDGPADAGVDADGSSEAGPGDVGPGDVGPGDATTDGDASATDAPPTDAPPTDAQTVDGTPG